MQKVRVNLYASLRRYGGETPSLELDVEAGTTVGQMLATLGIPAGETRILFVNHRSATLDYILSGGEQVGVFPVIGGG